MWLLKKKKTEKDRLISEVFSEADQQELRTILSGFDVLLKLPLVKLYLYQNVKEWLDEIQSAKGDSVEAWCTRISRINSCCHILANSIRYYTLDLGKQNKIPAQLEDLADKMKHKLCKLVDSNETK